MSMTFIYVFIILFYVELKCIFRLYLRTFKTELCIYLYNILLLYNFYDIDLINHLCLDRKSVIKLTRTI